MIRPSYSWRVGESLHKVGGVAFNPASGVLLFDAWLAVEGFEDFLNDLFLRDVFWCAPPHPSLTVRERSFEYSTAIG